MTKLSRISLACPLRCLPVCCMFRCNGRWSCSAFCSCHHCDHKHGRSSHIRVVMMILMMMMMMMWSLVGCFLGHEITGYNEIFCQLTWEEVAYRSGAEGALRETLPQGWARLVQSMQSSFLISFVHRCRYGVTRYKSKLVLSLLRTVLHATPKEDTIWSHTQKGCGSCSLEVVGPFRESGRAS